MAQPYRGRLREASPVSSPATNKGHMERKKQGIQSMKGNIKEALASIETGRNINPPMENEKMNHLFCYLAAIGHKDGTI